MPLQGFEVVALIGGTVPSDRTMQPYDAESIEVSWRPHRKAAEEYRREQERRGGVMRAFIRS